MDCQYLPGSVPTLVLNVDRVKSFDNLHKPDVVQRYVVQRYGAAVAAVASALRPCGLQLAASVQFLFSCGNCDLLCYTGRRLAECKGKSCWPKRCGSEIRNSPIDTGLEDQAAEDQETRA